MKKRILITLAKEPFSILVETFAKHITQYCSTCQKNRLDLFFEYYQDKNTKLCPDCLLHAKLFCTVVEWLFSCLNVGKDTISLFFTDYKNVSESIIKGIARFGLRKPFVTGSPIAVVWTYTNICNLQCGHCYADANASDTKELTLKERLLVIDHLVDSGVVALNFSGGEPLMRKDLFTVAEYARDNNLKISLSTNGTLLTKECVKTLHKIGITSIDISLDGINPGTHDSIRNVPGSFDKAVKGLKNCVSAGFLNVVVNTTLTQATFNEIPLIYEFVKTLGATRYYVSRILPTGRGKSFLHHDVSPHKKIEILTFLHEKTRNYINGKDDILCLARGMTYYAKPCEEGGDLFPACEILTGYEPEYTSFNNLPFIIASLKELFSGCATGLTYCGLDPSGQILPCAPASDIRLGSILQEGLESIWLNHPILQKVRERHDLKGSCRYCDSRPYCGGCRLTAFGMTGDWLSADPSCPF